MEPRHRMGVILLVSGSISAGVVLFLFYALQAPSGRGGTFAFTAWFSAFQVIALFGALAYAGIRDARPGSVVPVNSAVVVIVLSYNVASVATILFFHWQWLLRSAPFHWLLPQRFSPREYYAILIAETGLVVAGVILIQIVAVVHRVGHAASSRARDAAETLVVTCDRLNAAAAVSGWKLDLRNAAERIRFSEGIRRNEALAGEVSALLSRLETLVGAKPDDQTSCEAERIVSEIHALTARRA